MKAIVLKGVEDLVIEELEKPVISAHEVLYEVHAASLCTVEQRVYKGKKNFGYPFLGGHENAGIVVAVGEEVQDIKVGDHVVATFNYCGECEYCKTGRGTKCKHSMKTKKRVDFEGTIIGGGLAQYLAVPAQQVCKVQKGVDFEKYALTEPLACCIHSIDKAKIKFGDNVVIIGAGIMGLLHAKLAQLRGARVIVSEMDPERRKKALKLGAHDVIDPSSEDAIEKVKELTNGVGADVVVNAIAVASIWNDAIDMLAPYGRLIAYSSQDTPDLIPISFDRLHSKEYEFIGTVSPTMESNLRATKLIAQGIIDTSKYIDSVYPMNMAKQAFERASEPNTYRVVIKMTETE